MAGERVELNALAAAVAAIDDDALAALANRGLVRRAHKDLEKARPRCIETTGDHAVFEVEGCRVVLGAAPAEAKCDCGASSICRHILATMIHLRDHVAVPEAGAAAETAGNAGVEIMSVGDAALESWAGKAVFRRALKSPRDDAVFESAATPVIQLPTRNVTVRWIPGQGLNGMVCSCHALGPCEHKVAAVLAFWAREGRQSPASPEKPLDTSTGAPRTRAEVLESVRQVLREMVTLGIGRVSEATRQRLDTLAVSAHGVDLPRLERLLSALAEETGLLLRRDAQGSAVQVLHTAARIWALTLALEKPSPALVGFHRSRYEQVPGELDLIGLGARQWRARSGYQGITVYFWETQSQRWNTWTDARPVGMQFQPAARYLQPLPWAGVRDPREASRSHYRLSNVHRNPVGRLSGRAGTRGRCIGSSNLGPAPPIRKWPDLLPQLERLYGGGLAERSEQDEIVLLAPARVEDAVFDDATQSLRRPLLDADGRVLHLVVRHDETAPEAINHVEAMPGNDMIAVLGLLRVGQEGVFVEPVTLATTRKLLHITLDGVTPAENDAEQVAGPDESTGEEADESDRDTSGTPRSPVGLLIQQAIESLEEIAESGVRAPRDLETLRGHAARMESLGLETCRRAVVAVAESLERVRRERDAPDAASRILDSSYVLRLALQQETLSLWTRQLA